MSLFGVREWWGVAPGASEEFGGGCVTVGATGALAVVPVQIRGEGRVRVSEFLLHLLRPAVASLILYSYGFEDGFEWLAFRESVPSSPEVFISMSFSSFAKPREAA